MQDCPANLVFDPALAIWNCVLMKKITGLALLSLLTLGLFPAFAKAQDDFTLSQTAADALVAVVAHEMGHAVLREL